MSKELKILGLLCVSQNYEYDDFLSFLDFGDNRVKILSQWANDTLYGKQVDFRYFVSTNRIDPNTVWEEYLEMFYAGKSTTRHQAYYSEITGYLYTKEDFNIGGHDMLKELESHVGKFIYMIITIH